MSTITPETLRGIGHALYSGGATGSAKAVYAAADAWEAAEKTVLFLVGGDPAEAKRFTDLAASDTKSSDEPDTPSTAHDDFGRVV